MSDSVIHSEQAAQRGALGLPIYQVLSLLLSYPQRDLLELLPSLRTATAGPCEAMLQPLFQHLGTGDLIDLQECYVATFDRKSVHSLHLFEHIHGESRDRGQALVDLLQEYRSHGLAPSCSELPDYVPLFLEFLAQIPPSDAEALLDDAIHVLARLGNKLTESGSAYAGAFSVLRTLTTVEPQDLPAPPAGEMEETMVTFGPQACGNEPTLRRNATDDGSRPVRFYTSAGKPMVVPATRSQP